VVRTVTYTDPAAGALLTSTCDTDETVLTGGATQPLGVLNVVSGILQTSAPTLSGALATTGQTADGWGVSFGVLGGVFGLILPTGDYTVYVVCGAASS
jgi:hypothetical protein